VVNEPGIHRNIRRIEASTIAGLTSCGVATIVEALGPIAGPQQTMAEQIARRSTRATVGGQAITVVTGLADNLMMHAALRVARPGDVLVVSCAGSPGAQWGEIVTQGARQRGIAGVVTDGAVRDIDEIEKLGFPVWAASVRPLGARKDVLGWVNRPANCGGVRVAPGDVIIADGDGVVVVPRGIAAETLASAQARVTREDATRRAIAEGQLSGDLNGLYAKLDKSGIGVTEEVWSEE
jgi:4-hydroxy-4-methyl-2-oxoglutarate aldolase